MTVFFARVLSLNNRQKKIRINVYGEKKYRTAVLCHAVHMYPSIRCHLYFITIHVVIFITFNFMDIEYSLFLFIPVYEIRSKYSVQTNFLVVGIFLPCLNVCLHSSVRETTVIHDSKRANKLNWICCRILHNEYVIYCSPVLVLL